MALMTQASAVPQDRTGADRMVQIWLLAVALLVFCMIVVGGATRLTDSGLSITEWKPILGAIPPLSDADWHAAFTKYREIPEYKLVNAGMSLAEFKLIYWWEWSHRFLGRFIGVAFAVPFAVFWLMGALRPAWWPKLLALLTLGALQGAIGWYMVQSGLVDRVDVSQYRLALHLSVAFLIFALLIWFALDLSPREKTQTSDSGVRTMAFVLLGVVFLQIVLGAFVAGLKAGFTYNTWPLMDGKLVPDGLGMLSPWYLNLFENVTTVQFNHRSVAYVVAALMLANLWLVVSPLGWGDARTKSAALVGVAVLAQILLGIWTLLAVVPLSLGLVHQAGAAILFGLTVRHAHLVTR